VGSAGGSSEHFQVDGQRAIFVPRSDGTPSVDGTWADLVVVRVCAPMPENRRSLAVTKQVSIGCCRRPTTRATASPSRQATARSRSLPEAVQPKAGLRPLGRREPGQKLYTSSNGLPDPAAPNFPSFVIVNTQNPAAKVRVRTEVDTGEGSLVLLPDGGGFAGVIFVDRPGTEVCDGDPPPYEGMVTMRVELMDASDAVEVRWDRRLTDAATWSGWRDLNPRPLRPERSALPS